MYWLKQSRATRLAGLAVTLTTALPALAGSAFTITSPGLGTLGRALAWLWRLMV